MSEPATPDLATVRILGLPLGVRERASEHNDDLLRELPESLQFRRWFLDEFSRQIAGEAPPSWATFTAGAAMETAPPG